MIQMNDPAACCHMPSRPQRACRVVLHGALATLPLLAFLPLWAAAPAPTSAQAQAQAPAPRPASAPAAEWAPLPAPPASQHRMQVVGAGRAAAPAAALPAARDSMRAAEPYAPISAPQGTALEPELELYVGESRVFPVPGVARIAVGNGQVMTASALDDNQMILFGNALGTSSLSVWHADGRHQRVKVNIVPADTGRVAREVAAFLTRIPNATASVVGDKVIVEGDELSDAARDKVAELAKRYPQIVNFTSPIGWEQMVLLDVKVVEFPKTELRELGLKWTPTGGGAIGAVWGTGKRGDVSGLKLNIISPPGGPAPINSLDNGPVPLPSSLTIMSGINIGLNAQLNLLEQNGSASILAEPQLSARSGVKASFLAGGEFPYSVSSLTGVTVMFKPYGIKLDIEPKVGRNGVIRAAIDSEISSIDASVSTASGPALLTRRTQTEFNVRSGETIVLSGLLQRSSSTDIDKVPLLGDIPVLGALFRSKRFQNKETELVVFVTPTVVDGKSSGLAERVERAGARLGERFGKSPYLSDPLQPASDAAKVFAPLAAPQQQQEQQQPSARSPRSRHARH
jgi:pilus assembly protein CpaC